MKISYIANSAPVGTNASSLQIMKMCEQFTKLGNCVTLITPDSGLRNISPFKFYGIKSKFKVLRIKFFKKFPIGIYYYLFALLSIFFAIKGKTELVITRNFFVCFLLSIIKKKCILEFHHDLTMEGRIVKFIVKYFNFLNSNNTVKIVSITQSIADYFISNYNVDKNKIIILPSGSSEFKKFKFNKNKKKLNIGYFGLMDTSRGLNLLTNLSNIDQSNDYFLFGSKPNEIKKIKKKNFFNNLFVFSHIPYNKISLSYEKMDVLIMPYTNKVTTAGNFGNIGKYTSPLKLFDYLSSGKVIIASELLVLKEILKNNYNCIFIKNYTNAKAWKNEITKLKYNYFKRRLLSYNSFKTSKKYGLKTRAVKYLENIQ